jgi:predicted RNase H-like HicB family nuclease
MPTDVLEFTANVHREEDGSYWAEVVELPGCFASGFDLDELTEALAEAIEMCLPDAQNGGRSEQKFRLGSLRMQSGVPA